MNNSETSYYKTEEEAVTYKAISSVKGQKKKKKKKKISLDNYFPENLTLKKVKK